MKNLFNQKRKDFRDLLDESRGLINPISSWDTVVKMIKDDKRF
jgi:hypothetical protein